ncbi:2-oxo-4-hydroxy-4-carboxy-5-ureidoimidazoline decarboxylase [Streptomyces sp. NPDC047108]|uniref:2-oxo-4-hydroxy-4-carboxy-5-ureidoimidazoline decarboxylase n=1 Tax=Streptomyces sp. NPDC047108 TaxID=3155025 RepID=UPI0033CC742C
MLTSDFPAGPARQEPPTPAARRARRPVPAQSRGSGPAVTAPLSRLERFNTAGPDAAETALLACCGSRRWAHRLVNHRPYPDVAALLAAADEASYDMAPSDLAEALGGESVSHALPARAPSAALTALRAAQQAYEDRFGHVFVVCLDALRQDELLDHVLAALRTRLAHEVDEERAVTADELRRIARGRLARLVA